MNGQFLLISVCLVNARRQLSPFCWASIGMHAKLLHILLFVLIIERPSCENDNVRMSLDIHGGTKYFTTNANAALCCSFCIWSFYRLYKCFQVAPLVGKTVNLTWKKPVAEFRSAVTCSHSGVSEKDPTCDLKKKIFKSKSSYQAVIWF